MHLTEYSFYCLYKLIKLIYIFFVCIIFVLYYINYLLKYHFYKILQLSKKMNIGKVFKKNIHILNIFHIFIIPNLTHNELCFQSKDNRI